MSSRRNESLQFKKSWKKRRTPTMIRFLGNTTTPICGSDLDQYCTFFPSFQLCGMQSHWLFSACIFHQKRRSKTLAFPCCVRGTSSRLFARKGRWYGSPRVDYSVQDSSGLSGNMMTLRAFWNSIYFHQNKNMGIYLGGLDPLSTKMRYYTVTILYILS